MVIACLDSAGGSSNSPQGIIVRQFDVQNDPRQQPPSHALQLLIPVTLLATILTMVLIDNATAFLDHEEVNCNDLSTSDFGQN